MIALMPVEESRSSPTNKAKLIACKRALESMVIHALRGIDDSLHHRESLRFAITHGEDDDYVLHAEEARLLAPSASKKRLIEWASGRRAAHLTLRRLGFDNPPPVLREAAGEPLWPDGIGGSISHCYPWSIAVAAKCSARLTIGIDLESLVRMARVDISRVACRKAELEWVSAEDDFQGRVGMIFSAKEAVYKALYPLCRRYIDFEEVELSWLREESRFDVDILAPFAASFVPSLMCKVYCRRQANFVFSCALCQIS